MSLLEEINRLNGNEIEVIEKQSNNPFSGNGIPAHLTVTYHEKCGRRLSLGREMFNKLGKPNDIKISFEGKFLVVRDGKGEGYHLSKVSSGKPILYNALVTKRVVDNFSIDLSKHTTHSFYNGEFVNGAFYIEMLPQSEEPEAEEFAKKETDFTEEDILEEEEAEGEGKVVSSPKEPDVTDSATEEEEDDLFFEEEE